MVQGFSPFHVLEHVCSKMMRKGGPQTTVNKQTKCPKQLSEQNEGSTVLVWMESVFQRFGWVFVCLFVVVLNIILWGVGGGVCARAHASYTLEQLLGVNSFLLPCGFLESNSGCQA